jgi:hypothetical protein
MKKESEEEKKEEELGLDIRVEFRTKGLVCLRIDDDVLVLGKAKNNKQVVLVGRFEEVGGELVFQPTDVAWHIGDIEALLDAARHFQSGV